MFCKVKMSQVYKMIDGKFFSADSNEDIVKQLREISFVKCETENAFMEQISSAAKTWNGSIISTYNYDEFAADLIANRFIIPVNN